MALCFICMRRSAIALALTGGLLFAVAGAGVCAEGLVFLGSSCVGAVKTVASIAGI